MYQKKLERALRLLIRIFVLGKNISMMEMCKLIPTLVRAFEIQWVGDVDKNEWEIENQWFARQKGLVVRFWPRLQRHRVEKDSLGKIRDGKD
jgi:hypothetical protein